jgi:hypothetical protein
MPRLQAQLDLENKAKFSFRNRRRAKLLLKTVSQKYGLSMANSGRWHKKTQLIQAQMAKTLVQYTIFPGRVEVCA